MQCISPGKICIVYRVVAGTYISTRHSLLPDNSSGSARKMRCRLLLLGVVVIALGSVAALENGLARKPPMGWMTWQRFRCITDCDKYPDECISEQLIKRMADLMVSEGYLDAGYEYVNIDDCWSMMERDADGILWPNPERFPNGMKHLADYVRLQACKA